MSVKVVNNKKEVIDRINRMLIDAMIVARNHLETHIKDLTPVITGKLRLSTYGKEIKHEQHRIYCQVWQTAEYAIYVEARRFHFTFGIRNAEPGIKDIFRKVRI